MKRIKKKVYTNENLWWLRLLKSLFCKGVAWVISQSSYDKISFPVYIILSLNYSVLVMG